MNETYKAYVSEPSVSRQTTQPANNAFVNTVWDAVYPSSDVIQIHAPATTEKLKPILKYPGGKGRELKHIIPIVPRMVNRFFEPFVGGGATYFALDGISQYFINDISKELIATYNAVKAQDTTFLRILTLLNKDWKFLSALDYSYDNFDMSDFSYVEILSIVHTDELKSYFINYAKKMFKQKKDYIKKLAGKGGNVSEKNKGKLLETVLKSSYYATVRKIYNENRQAKAVDDNAAYFFFIREFCYSSMFRFSASGDFNVPYGGMSYNSKDLDDKLKYLLSHSLRTRLNQTEIFDIDFQEFLESYKFTSRDFIFVDPPYDTEFSTYDENEFNQRDQKRLADFLRSTKAKWLLVIKDTDYIRSLYPESDKHLFYREFDKNYSVSFMNRNDRNANHLMITNYGVK